MPRKFFDSSQCIKSRSAISGVIFMQQASDMCIKPYKLRSEIKSPLNHLLYRSFQKWLGYDLRLCIKSKLVMFQSEFRNECLNLTENGCFRLGHLYTYAVNGHIHSTMLQKLSKCKVKDWWFYRHSDFTWNQILANWNSPKMSFLAILETLNFEFW